MHLRRSLCRLYLAQSSLPYQPLLHLTDRIGRIAQEKGITEAQAADLIEKTDRSRADYYNYYSGKTWGAAESYDLCINTSHLGFEGTAEMLINFIDKARS